MSRMLAQVVTLTVAFAIGVSSHLLWLILTSPTTIQVPIPSIELVSPAPPAEPANLPKLPERHNLEPCFGPNEMKKYKVREVTGTVYGGVLNGKTLCGPPPTYPGHVRVSGAVLVDVLVDEYGEVAWAKALSGHPLLMAGAVEAAGKTRFAPALLGGESVRVRGFIRYEF